MVSPPDWLTQFANSAVEFLRTHDVLPPIGCHFHQTDSVWEITLFASATEIVGGPEDGRTRYSSFYVDVKNLLELFSHVDAVSWQTQALGETDELGAHLAIEGLYLDKLVSLRITAIPPERFEIGRRALVHQQKFQQIW